jgi:fermentation-respiration switch protein FrsA (DUF1100 family)
MEAFKQEFKPIDPETLVSSLSPAPVLFQFGVKDVHVPAKKAEAFFAAAAEPKEINWYEAGHGLNENALNDRIDWLTSELSLED